MELVKKIESKDMFDKLSKIKDKVELYPETFSFRTSEKGFEYKRSNNLLVSSG